MFGKGVELHPGQAEVLRSKARFKVLCSGRRFGKSFLSAVTLILAATGGPRRKVWYISPSYRMSKQIIWDVLLDMLPKKWIKKVHHTELSIRLVNDSLIECKGADNPDTLRGVGLFYAVLDEFQDIKSDTWSKVIRPTLARDRGHALFTGTPKGKSGEMYEMFVMGLSEDNPQWKSWQFRTVDSPFIPEEEIEAARADLDPKSFEQEFCHLPDTELLLSDGSVVAISNVEIGSMIKYLSDDGDLRDCTVVNRVCTGTKPIVSVTLETGDTFSASDGHKMKVNNKKVRLDEIAFVEKVFMEKELTKDEKLAALVGYNMGGSTKGTSTYHSIGSAFYAKPKVDVESICKDLYESGITNRLNEPTLKKGRKPENNTYQVQLAVKATRELMRLGCPIGRKTEVCFEVPQWIREGSDGVKRAFLSALWGAEGSTPSTQSQKGLKVKLPKMPVLSMTKRDGKADGTLFFLQLQTMMKELGVETVVRREDTRIVSGHDYTTYRIYVGGGIDNRLAFFENIGFRYAREKSFKAFLWIEYMKAWKADARKRVDDVVARKEAGMNFGEIGREIGKKKGTARATYKAYQKNGYNGVRSGWDFPDFNTWVEGRIC